VPLAFGAGEIPTTVPVVGDRKDVQVVSLDNGRADVAAEQLQVFGWHMTPDVGFDAGAIVTLRGYDDTREVCLMSFIFDADEPLSGIFVLPVPVYGALRVSLQGNIAGLEATVRAYTHDPNTLRVRVP
jgi:hypothetical protein